MGLGIALFVALLAFWFVDMNPLNVTFHGQVDYNGQNYTEQVIDAQVFVDPVVHQISSFDEAKITDRLMVYQLPDEYMHNLCPSLDALNAGMKDTEVTVNHYYDVYGANVVGCKNMDTETITYPGKMPANMSMSFFSEMIRPENLPATVRDNRIKAVSGFVSYYDHPYLSAPQHAAAVASIAIQCVGDKVWGFQAPSGNKRHGLLSFFGGVIARGIDGDTPMYIVQTKPGTVITFPAFWAHWVLTKPGPNFMYTPRIPMLAIAFWRHRLSMWNTVREIFWENVLSGGEKATSALDRAVELDDETVNYDKKAKPCDNEIPLDLLQKLMKRLNVEHWPMSVRNGGRG